MEQDHYAILGLGRAADQAEIRAAYRRLMRQCHPDADASAEAAEQARAINQAYAVLSDQGERTRFDRSVTIEHPLTFEPAFETPHRRRSLAAPIFAIGIALVAAALIAFAILSPKRPPWLGSAVAREGAGAF